MSLEDYLNSGTSADKPEGVSRKPTVRSPYSVPPSSLAQWNEPGTDPYPRPGAKPPPPPPTIGKVFIDTLVKGVRDTAVSDTQAAAGVIVSSLKEYTANGLPDELRTPERTGPVIPEPVRNTAANIARAAGGFLRDAVVFLYGQMTSSSRQAPHHEPPNSADAQPESGAYQTEPAQPLLLDSNVVEGEFTVIE